MTSIDEYIAGLDPAQAQIATELASHLTAALPDASAQVWHSHPVWLDGTTPLAGFKAHPRWVTLMIWGDVDDASGTLEQGARMATVKLTEPGRVDAAQVSKWLGR